MVHEQIDYKTIVGKRSCHSHIKWDM